MRNTFQACTTKEFTETFYNRLNDQSGTDPIYSGYKGAVIALRAKYNPNPIKKFNFCKEGLNLISIAIGDSPFDLELRYLRLIIESNIPTFLGMNNNVQEDKNVIMKNLGSERDLHLKKLVSQFLLKSDICSDGEKKLLAGIK